LFFLSFFLSNNYFGFSNSLNLSCIFVVVFLLVFWVGRGGQSMSDDR
jgi:hypothetical protein